MQSHKKEFVWNILSNFEKITASLPQTKDIILGKKVKGVQYGELIQIKEYAKGVDFIINLIEHNVFDQSKHILCCIHSCIASKEVSQEQLGRFRTWDVTLHKVKYKPPKHSLLDELWNESLKFNNIKNPVEQALIHFLNLSRTQFFYDNNKRTAMLYANALLITKKFDHFIYQLKITKNSYLI